tara:strand:+ start:443 stop:709 length:267 start_codon:yes stop_codon:yes gene_type:complete
MRTEHLDNKINELETLRSRGELTYMGGEMLSEFNEIKQALLIQRVSQQSELLPDFLYEDDGIIRAGVHGDSAVTDEWNDYLKKTGNCG